MQTFSIRTTLLTVTCSSTIQTERGVAFLLQQWLHEGVTLLGYTQNACLGLLKYSVIQKDGLIFVRLYFLNYIRYVNDLHNI